jgi:hypothetical protein
MTGNSPLADGACASVKSLRNDAQRRQPALRARGHAAWRVTQLQACRTLYLKIIWEIVAQTSRLKLFHNLFVKIWRKNHW